MKKEIIWYDKPKKRRLDSVWYGGDMVKIIINKRYYCTIAAVGDIRVKIDGEYYVDKSNGGRIREYLEEHNIKTDAQLKKAEKQGRVVFGDNNWFEVIFNS